MIAKQDLTVSRTPADTERKYGGKFSEILGIAEDARDEAKGASASVAELDESLGQDGIFNRLTNNGQWKGLYKDDDGNIYLNADYIKTGVLLAIALNSLADDGDYVKIEDGMIMAGNGGSQHFSLMPFGTDGAWAITFNNEVADGEQTLRVHGSMKWNSISLGTVEQDPSPFQVDAESNPTAPTVQLQIPLSIAGASDKNVLNLYAYWELQSDGKYHLVGYPNKLQGG